MKINRKGKPGHQTNKKPCMETVGKNHQQENRKPTETRVLAGDPQLKLVVGDI